MSFNSYIYLPVIANVMEDTAYSRGAISYLKTNVRQNELPSNKLMKILLSGAVGGRLSFVNHPWNGDPISKFRLSC